MSVLLAKLRVVTHVVVMPIPNVAITVRGLLCVVPVLIVLTLAIRQLQKQIRIQIQGQGLHQGQELHQTQEPEAGPVLVQEQAAGPAAIMAPAVEETQQVVVVILAVAGLVAAGNAAYSFQDLNQIGNT